jgi:subtilisin family serine protease
MARRSVRDRFKGIQFTPPGPTDGLEGAQPRAAAMAKTLVYVHGIGNKPVASVLKKQWDQALFAVDLGERSRMAYWVNRDYYPIPMDGDVPEGKRAPLAEPESLAWKLHPESSFPGVDEDIRSEVESLTDDSRKQKKLLAIARKMQEKQTSPEADAELRSLASSVEAEALPTKFLRRVVTRNITRAFLRDVYDFLYDEKARQRMERSLEPRLKSGGPFVVIGNSLGSLIAYEVLRKLTRAECDVRLFVTTGAPLGIEEIKDGLREFTDSNLAVPACVARWVNVADRLDPVALDVTLANEYAATGGVRIEDFYRLRLNPDSPRHPHSGTGYLQTKPVAEAVQKAVGPCFAEPIATFSLARDAAAFIEDQLPNERTRLLIELNQVEGVQGLGAQRDRVVSALQSLEDFNPQVAELEKLQRFVAVKLTRAETEKLADTLQSLQLGRIWRNSEKMTVIADSCNTVQVRPAWESFKSTGERIRWAVLDTGVAGTHPHFHYDGWNTMEAQFDCTRWSLEGEAYPLRAGDHDVNGHGTHVAAIIAGQMKVDCDGKPTMLSGMAPRTSLVSYKVLDDVGRGHDSSIIKALQHIAETNESSGELVIHGINLSLGGSFDPTIYGCGHSPLCNELRRLWRQGVLACVAAGNRGMTEIQTRSGFIDANLDLTIGDPANLEETIAVGSVHKLNPFTYGISYFSSRGPTADGRIKPDLVAPGERILSARAQFGADKSKDIRDLYVELSGTSMAAPHVSGMLAAFLSLRREYIGYPDRVKKILLDSCAPLERDAYSQGRGLPSLMKMLSNS